MPILIRYKEVLTATQLAKIAQGLKSQSDSLDLNSQSQQNTNSGDSQNSQRIAALDENENFTETFDACLSEHILSQLRMNRSEEDSIHIRKLNRVFKNMTEKIEQQGDQIKSLRTEVEYLITKLEFARKMLESKD